MINNEIKKGIKNQTLGYLTGALGLVAGLAWNDAVKSLIEMLFPLNASSVWVKFIYAIIITIIVVLVGQYILKLSSEEEQ